MTAPDMVSVIAAAITLHARARAADRFNNWNCEGCGELIHCGRKSRAEEALAAHQARAVLAAISEAGAVEWGVQWSGDGTEREPLHAPTLAGAQQVAEALAKITPAGGQQPIPVWRFTGPWTWVAQ